jgi:malate synthase
MFVPRRASPKTAKATESPKGRVRVRGAALARGPEILSPEALDFLTTLHDRFEAPRKEALRKRGAFRATLRAGQSPDFPAETASVRAGEWKVPPPPEDLRDRRVEITGPVDRKMVINALNSGACVYMADFEDSHSPVWSATVAGQVNLLDAVRQRIEYRGPDGREYRLAPTTATLMVRPRGWHLEERHVEIDGHPISASLFDFGLFFFHNARELVARGSGPYFYVPKIEHYREARLWSEVIRASEEALGLRIGTARVTALIETLPAAFQMDEILYELRENSVGLNCGRWDYLFSFIKQYRDERHVVFPDRSALSMATPFLSAYSRLLIQTCHRRGAHAMGGMAAQIPIRDDPAANERAMALVQADKEREVRAGHDGTWVAHPGLVPLARAVFDAGMKGANQIHVARTDPPVVADDLLQFPEGPVTQEGVRRNARVALRYLEAWLRGVGCVPIDHLMEDAATVEIARSQLWQWIHHRATTETGARVNAALFRAVLATEVEALMPELSPPGPGATLRMAVGLLKQVVLAPDLEEFITTRAYPELEDLRGSGR